MTWLNVPLINNTESLDVNNSNSTETLQVSSKQNENFPFDIFLFFFLAEETKKKWKSLRDAFGKELKKVPEKRSGDEAPLNYETYTTWPYFDSMLFLKDQMRPRKSGGNLRVGDAETVENEDLHEGEPGMNRSYRNDVIDTPETHDIKCTDETIPPPPHKYGKRGRAQQQLLAIEAKKLKLLEQKVQKAVGGDDEDEAFFKSLLPHVRKLPPEQKLLFRMDVQKAVHKYVYTNNELLNNPNRTVDLFTASSSADAVAYQHSTPVRNSTAFFDTGLRTPPDTRIYELPPEHSQAEVVAIQLEGQPLQRSTIISSARKYYTVITSPISSAGTQN
ncbi:uncharacterized protein LOC134209825 [Armigeres subalbatus]|uniref:uncharacterized protein LOC134209825 n=1 Tax=Armigeres subalbatus TaxID=124917 RepID=UPI002ED328EC